MKKGVVVGLSIGAGTVLAIVLALWGVYLHYHPSSPAKRWPLTTEAAGITVGVTTELRRGQILYQLHIVPARPEQKAAFDSAVNDNSSKQITLDFDDADGFKLCSQTVTEFVTVVNGLGSVSGLESKGELSGCSADDYTRAKSLEVGYVFPTLPTQADTARIDHRAGLAQNPKRK